ncbi:MAG TPA: protein kinase [Planctomycetota bacterium]
MNSFEKVLARICLEHGWAGRAEIAEAVRARNQDPAAQSASLASYLVARRILSPEQASQLQEEAGEVTKSGRYADVREDDTGIGRILVEAGAAAPEHIEEALALQKSFSTSQATVPRIGEILIEKGYLTFAALQTALVRQSRLVRLSCTACAAHFTAEPSPGKVFVCPKCAGPLSDSTRMPPVDVTEPPEVTRAAENIENVLGKYILTSPLGKGSMGAVYKAWDRGLRRWVAVKLLLITKDPQLVLRFRREAETSAAIQHPNIVPIYDVGESQGRPYLVMKYVEGSTLIGMSLTLEQSLRTLLQAAKGVAYAHEHNVVHRDLKPGNIMIDGSGHVYVMDFGLAKDLYNASGLTAPGTIMGTPTYMSPEQAAGKSERVNCSSDVYALGAILYELLTGRPPFKGPRAIETLRMVLEDPVVPPTKTNPSVPPAVEAVVLKALQKDRADRYPFAADFARALEAATQAPAAKKSTAKVIFWAVILLVLSCLAGFGVLQLLRGGPVPTEP